ncbi:shikimate dehydrogenase [uncultured Cohaesibacter sp.]|uniref:shikimate dehydrogenase n=1 Tax=uncultured Cohaesibacter sp. TaxID=1002546 RepID=UPI0029C901FD|nr:shikimate dehydrogenase [uncultured Cohaesibacter sp.]
MSERSSSLSKAFVIGWPIGQSKSPIIHSHWLRHHGLEGSYEKIAVAPEKLGAFIAQMKQEGYAGGNVTIPHKQAVLEHVDIIHPAAERLLAANTLWFEDGKLHADNTDGYGFLANLDQCQPGWDAKSAANAMILGAGGAARPVINGLIERGFDKVTIANRTKEKAEALARLFDGLGLGRHVAVIDWEQRSDELADIDCLVNCSSLGMIGQPPLEIALDALPPAALVTDIVYNPLETDILRLARQKGNPTVDGLGMLLHQAVPGFEHWFGKRPEVSEALRDEVLQHL